jgi:hypothetical protein
MDNFDFFVKSDLSAFSGKWVAIFNEKVVAFGESFKEVAEKADKEFAKKKVLFAKIPDKTARIL